MGTVVGEEFDNGNSSELSNGLRGSINISDVSLTPTDGRKIDHSPEDQCKRRLSNRKPFMHPKWYANVRNVCEKCEHCGSAVQQHEESGQSGNEEFNPSATFIRHKYYSRLTDPYDERMRMPDHILPSSFFNFFPSTVEAKQSSIVTIFAIWNTMMGTSLLSMPWGISQSGFTFGIILIVFTALLTLYTAYRVVSSKDYLDYQAFEFSDVVKHYFGKIGELTAVVFGLLAFIGGMMVYWVFMSNFLYMTGIFIHDKVTQNTSTNGTTNFSDVVCVNAQPVENSSGIQFLSIYNNASDQTMFQKLWNVTETTPLYLLLILFPLLHFKSPTFFTKFNCFGTISVIYLWILIVVKAANWGFHMDFAAADDVSVPEFRPTFPALTGMLSLAFFLHNAVITILRNNRNQENNVRDLSCAYLLVMATYLFVGTVFYASFPLPKSCISSNLLDNLTSSDPLAVGARAFLLFQMITVFPLLAYMSRIQIMHACFGNIWPGTFHVFILNMVLVAMCVLIAMFYPHVGDIIRYSGSLCGLVYIFVLPASVYLLAEHEKKTLKPASAIAHCLIIALGFGNFIAQFLITASK